MVPPNRTPAKGRDDIRLHTSQLVRPQTIIVVRKSGTMPPLNVIRRVRKDDRKSFWVLMALGEAVLNVAVVRDADPLPKVVLGVTL